MKIGQTTNNAHIYYFTTAKAIMDHVQYQLLIWASSTLLRRSEITWAGSGAPKTELPATMQLAPAEAAWSIVEGPKPPSTCKQN